MPLYFKLDIEHCETGKILDDNGNTVGGWSFYKDDPGDGT